MRCTHLMVMYHLHHHDVLNAAEWRPIGSATTRIIMTSASQWPWHLPTGTQLAYLPKISLKAGREVMRSVYLRTLGKRFSSSSCGASRHRRHGSCDCTA